MDGEASGVARFSPYAKTLLRTAAFGLGYYVNLSGVVDDAAQAVDERYLVDDPEGDPRDDEEVECRYVQDLIAQDFTSVHGVFAWTTFAEWVNLDDRCVDVCRLLRYLRERNVDLSVALREVGCPCHLADDLYNEIDERLARAGLVAVPAATA